MSVNVEVADVLAWARAYDGPKFHALLCDPPYHLVSGNAVYDLPLTGAGNPRTPRPTGKAGGFMGKQWDGGDIAFRPETWAALAEHLHPGAFIMAFASSRGWHRLACAIEDAGLIIHPSIFGWGTGQGFPKATRIDTQIDKANGREFEDRYALGRHIRERREAAGVTRAEVNERWGAVAICNHWEAQDANNASVPTPKDWAILKEWLDCDARFDALVDRVGAEREVVGVQHGAMSGWDMDGGTKFVSRDITLPATPLAAAWEGHRYGRQALKPALEPIIVAQKPYAGRPVDCIVATGAGSLWIDGARVPTASQADRDETERKNQHTRFANPGSNRDSYSGSMPPRTDYSAAAGRWPPNFALSHVGPSPCPCAAYTPDGAPVAGCRECGGGGVRPGCERVGVRRVRGTGEVTQGGVRRYTLDGANGPRRGKYHGPADADGLELVAEWRCTESCPVRRLGEQSGELAAGNHPRVRNTTGYIGGLKQGATGHDGRKMDAGNCSRFFPNHDYSLDIAERIAAADPVAYVAKASRRERNAGCEGLEERDGSVGDRRPSGSMSQRIHADEGRPETRARNPHPTVKPLALARWLATLLLPPAAYAPRRLLVPFAGSGSECLGGLLAGWEEIVGIEAEAEYADIARARVRWWSANRDKAPEVRGMTRAEPLHSRGGRDMRGGKFAAEDAIDRTTAPRNGHAAPAPKPIPLPGFEVSDE